MKNNQKPIPVYTNHMPPCNHFCPVGNNIQKWLFLTARGKWQEAWQAIMENNPLPATMGRVCYHPCESHCNRFGFDAEVNINGVERYLGDMALDKNWKIEVNKPKTGKKIMIIGAGPAGLAAAYHLTLMGHKAVIYEANPIAGGTMHTGIPSFRLPRNILNAEVQRIAEMGVEFIFNHKVTDVLAERDKGKFDAVFIGIGCLKSKEVNLPISGNSCKVIQAMDFLTDVEFNRQPEVADKKVLIYGGGNTAIDAARTAIRLGATSVDIIYRRTREKMPAYGFEISEAVEESVKLRCLRTIKQIDNNDVTIELMDLDNEGWPTPSGEIEILPADLVILALGSAVDTSYLRNIPGISFKTSGNIIVNDQMMTGCSGIFAGGDVLPFEKTVATALGHGKHAARCINAYLVEEKYVRPWSLEVAVAENLHTYYYHKSDRKERGQLGFPDRKKTFHEVVQGLDGNETSHEAKRCFSCGNCFRCDTCLNVCPVKAISKKPDNQGYAIDYETCIRCGLCAKRCPSWSIEMINKEENND